MVLFADRGNTARQLAQRIESDGATCVLVLAGESFKRINDEFFEIAPVPATTSVNCFVRFCRATGVFGHGIVHLWSLDAPPFEEMCAAAPTLPSIRPALTSRHSSASVLEGEPGAYPACGVTRGAQSVGGDPER